MIIDTSVYYRTIQTTATHIEKVVDTSVNGVYNGGISFTDYDTLKLDTSALSNRDPRVYRNDTHLFADSSQVDNMFSNEGIDIWTRDISTKLKALKDKTPYKDLYDAINKIIDN